MYNIKFMFRLLIFALVVFSFFSCKNLSNKKSKKVVGFYSDYYWKKKNRKKYWAINMELKPNGTYYYRDNHAGLSCMGCINYADDSGTWAMKNGNVLISSFDYPKNNNNYRVEKSYDKNLNGSYIKFIIVDSFYKDRPKSDLYGDFRLLLNHQYWDESSSLFSSYQTVKNPSLSKNYRIDTLLYKKLSPVKKYRVDVCFKKKCYEEFYFDSKEHNVIRLVIKTDTAYKNFYPRSYFRNEVLKFSNNYKTLKFRHYTLKRDEKPKGYDSFERSWIKRRVSSE